MHVVAGKAVCFREALDPSFRVYCEAVIENAKTLADCLMKGGLKLSSGGTENHLMLVDVTSVGLGGKLAEQSLDACGITVNMNMIPFDQRKPMDPSGIRIGTPALTTRGMGSDEMKQIGDWILAVLKDPENKSLLGETRTAVAELCDHFPVPADRISVAQ